MTRLKTLKKFAIFRPEKDEEVTNRFVINGYESEAHADLKKDPELIWQNSKKNGDYPNEKSSKLISKKIKKYIDKVQKDIYDTAEKIEKKKGKVKIIEDDNWHEDP